jgi:pyruvate formate lyase activating enzyme
MTTLANALDKLTTGGELYEKLEDGTLRCVACAHRCKINPGKRGICQVRFNAGGELRVPWGYVAALQADPIEKKPFSHFLPGATALTFGMLGCDFHCGYCQNWLTSQALRDPAADVALNLVQPVSPGELVKAARRAHADVIVSSYNEPLITSEWAVAVFKEAKTAGLQCAFVSNGNATPEALEYLRPYLSAYKVDLKSMQAKNYRSLGGVLQNVLDTIQRAHALGLWVEVVTLLVPGFNDSNEELFEIARFLGSVSMDIPWHVTAFHKDYKMTSPGNTPPETLVRAAEVGKEAGLKYVYAGNLPGRVDEYEDTHCPGCNKVLVRRRGYVVREYRLTAQGACPACGTKIPGIWPENPNSVRINAERIPLRVY